MATERGYEGTTISLVSKKSGLPPTSIYWHFADKDDLIAAVIERSFQRWLAALELPAGEARAAGDRSWGRRWPRRCWTRLTSCASGLMLRAGAPPGRTAGPGDVSSGPRQRVPPVRGRLCATSRPGLTRRASVCSTTYAIAGADGLFIAKEVGGDSVDLIKLFDLHARLVFESAVKLLQSGEPA